MRGRVNVSVGAAILVALALIGAASMSRTSAAASPSSAKLRGDLAALVAAERALDPAIPPLVAGYELGELPYFAVLSEPNDAAHEAQIAGLGARVLRRYSSVEAFALASSPSVVLQVAALPWVTWLAPVELVHALDHQPYVDQTKGTPADVAAPPRWDGGVTGKDVLIAVLDTGLAAHPDLDDLDFRHWDSLVNTPKVVDARDFNGGQCNPLLANEDLHGHGTHVAAIAAGTGEGTPFPDDDGKYAGVAPDAKLAIGKALTDAGAGLNSDLVTAMEWAAMDLGEPVDGCLGLTARGADIVNMSVGSQALPLRLNSGSDLDFVSFTLNRLAVMYGTLFSVAIGNERGYIGSALEAPGSASQAMVVGASAKLYDVRFDDTQSGDSCAGWQHDPPPSAFPVAVPCGQVNSHLLSLAAVSGRGPTGDVWLRPDVAAPGYNIVSAQSPGSQVAANDLNPGTRDDALYATATGTSMAAPAAAGSAALVLQAYRDAYPLAPEPTGESGLAGFPAPAYALFRAALMNTAVTDLYEARWIVPIGPAEFIGFEVRNRAADPFVGPFGEGAGRLDIGAAIAALRDGIVAYSAASGVGDDRGTGPRDFQGSWQIGAVTAGSTVTQRFVLHAAPSAAAASATFAWQAGNPSDASSAMPASWVTLPPGASLAAGGAAIVEVSATIPTDAAAGNYTARLRIQLSNGQTLRLPVYASVTLEDVDPKPGNASGPQAMIDSAPDVFARDNTSWPSVLGQAGGAASDWLVYPVELEAGLSEARFTVRDAAVPFDEVYDLYLYESDFDLLASTHPFASPGVTDTNANDARCPQAPCAPSALTLTAPLPGRYYIAVNRAKSGGGPRIGDFGEFVLALDTVRPPADLSLSKADSPDPILAGQELTYTIAVANGGPGEATGVVVTDVLPGGSTLVSASATQGSCGGATTVTCTLGTLPSGQTATVTIKTKPTTAGTISNTASAAAREADPDPLDNSATATTTVNPAADVAVTKSDSPDPVKVGQTLRYTVTVANTGPSSASGVTLNDQLPKNAGFGSAVTTQGSCSVKPAKRLVTCTLGSLAPGGTATITITIKPTAKGTIRNTATGTASSPVDPDPADNSATATTTVLP
jgi:uncharacterized repeat protein (TIGR01451 family)